MSTNEEALLGCEEEELMLQAARMREHPDWEGLMQIDVTPALLVDGERRLRRMRNQ